MKWLMIFAAFVTHSWAGLNSTPYGTIEPRILWPNHQVRVCWVTHSSELLSRESVRLSDATFAPVSKEEKARVRNLVNSNYKAETTGVSFVGWNDCNEEGELAKADALIVMNTSDLHKNTLGLSDVALGFEDASLRKDGGIDKLFFSRISDEEIRDTKRVVQFALQKMVDTKSALTMLKEKKPGRTSTDSLRQEELKVLSDTTILHEFGHLAGLRHEHCRKDRDKSKHSAWQFIFDSEDQMDSAVTHGTPYDHLSMMNYNHMGVVKSLFAARYVCEVSSSLLISTLKFRLNVSKDDCRRLDQAIRYMSALTAYDRHVLRMAYDSKSVEQDDDADIRTFIDKIVRLVKKSKLAPKQILSDHM